MPPQEQSDRFVIRVLSPSMLRKRALRRTGYPVSAGSSARETRWLSWVVDKRSRTRPPFEKRAASAGFSG